MKRSRVPVLLLLVAIAFALAARLVPWQRYPVVGHVYTSAQRVLGTPLFHLGALPISPAFLIEALLFLLFLGYFAGWSRRWFRLYLLDRFEMDAGHKYALATTVEYTVFVVGLLIGLQSAGVNLSSLALLGGALGIGVGFGLQSIVNNFVSGLVLLFEGPVKVGDRVEIAELNGDVIKIGARSTWVRTNDNIVVVIPNSDFIVKPVVNWTATDRQVRFSLEVGVSYGSDPAQVRDILLRVADRNPDVLSAPPPNVIFTEFGDSSLNFLLRYWTIGKVQYPLILKSDLYFAIFQAFKENGIEIPFPQRDLHLRSASPTVHVESVPSSAPER